MILKSFTLDKATCLILDKKPNASEYIRELVKRDIERIVPDTVEDELYTECECWLKIRQGEWSPGGPLHALESFPAWEELTAKEVEDMREYMEEELRRATESPLYDEERRKIAEDALLWLQTHKGKAMEELYDKFRLQWYHEKDEY